MRLLVTGGCGFVGSNFVNYVLRHYGPEMITNVDSLATGTLAGVEGIAREFGERYEFLHADVNDVDKIDAVLSTHHYFAVVNFTGGAPGGASAMAGLLDRARQHGVRRFLQVSSDRVFSSIAGGQGNQAAADALALDAFRTAEQEVVLTRAAGSYGPFQAPTDFIPASIIHALRDEAVPVPGEGSKMRGWLHVEDHASAIFAALLNGEPGTIYPVVNEQKFSDLDVVETILAHLGKSRDLIQLNGATRDSGPGISDEDHLAYKQLEWKPRKHFASALLETVDWYVHNREWWDRGEEEPQLIAL